jgi:hypothetical protein
MSATCCTQHISSAEICSDECAGLISAAPAGKKGEKGVLQVASQQVEAMVKAKMSKPEYTILCLEDNSDWTNATTRRIVMEVHFCPFLLLNTSSQCYTNLEQLNKFYS